MARQKWNYYREMKRRETIKKLIAASAGMMALPAWAEGWRAADLMHDSTTFSFQSQETLAAVADTIIPAGDSAGALSVEVDKFLQKLIEDCYEKEVQENVKRQLAALESSAQNLYNKSFKSCDQLQREALLMKFSQSSVEAEAEFFKLIKAETIRGFTTSREVMVNYFKYKQVPGHYYGCADANV